MTEKPHHHPARRRLRACVLAAAGIMCAVTLAACGGSDSGANLPDGVVARVGDRNITQAQLDRAMAQTEAGAVAQGQTFPKKGTKEYLDQERQALQSLLNVHVVEAEAKICGNPCAVPAATVNQRIDEIVKAQFQGKKAKLNEFLKLRKMTMAEARDQVRASIQQTKIQEYVTRGVRFDAADARKFYAANPAQYRVPAGRTASHILVKTEAEANRIAAEATPANFAALAKKYSTDAGTKDQGGTLGPIQKGQLVPEFEKVAFDLPEGTVSKPVKTQFGYHLILITKITPARTIPFSEARQQIISSQLDAKRNEKFQAWVKDTLKKWESKTAYANNDLKPVTATAPAVTPTAP